MSEKNVCDYKKACKSCVVVSDLNARPYLCEKMKCNDYVPCPKCGRNVQNEYPKGSCRICIISENREAKAAEEDETAVDVRNLARKEISLPGTPPKGFLDSEKEYYQYQWSLYEGYYRDPSAMPIAHNIIMLEIELTQTTSQMIGLKGEYLGEMAKKRTSIVTDIKHLKGLMPDKDAEEMSDDEKSLAMIHDKYVEQKKKRYTGGVARILTPEAIALNPKLLFKSDLVRLCENLGFQIREAEDLAHVPEDKDEALELFGYKLEEVEEDEDIEEDE